MRTLAIECATEACSAALFEGERLVEGRFEILGRGHAERLVPMIAELPDKGCADRILVSLGPGSFTGVRIGLAAARALGLAWNAKALGYPTLALVAAMARVDTRFDECDGAVTVCMNGGHGEWFVQDFGAGGAPDKMAVSLTPQDAASRSNQACIAGSKAAALAQLSGHALVRSLDLMPDARQAVLVPTSLLTSDLVPIYGRAPDARLPT